MTARLFSTKSTSVGSQFCPQPVSSLSSARSPRRTSDKSIESQSIEKPVRVRRVANENLIPIWGGLIESLQQGVIVVSPGLKPIYWNLKAKEICKELSEVGLSSLELPIAVSEVCHRLTRGTRTTNQPLVMECLAKGSQTIRISGQWFYPGAAFASGKVVSADLDDDLPYGSEPAETPQAYILVFLENCTDSLREELRIEQKKYDLTDREAEIWMLLRQEFTYQEIAKMLQISLNTVKTHVKNVYAKRRSFQGQEKFWCSE